MNKNIVVLGTRSIIIAENRNIAVNTSGITTKNKNIAAEQQNIWNHNTKIIPLLIGNNVHLPLRGGNLQQRRALLQ
jgi:hypothetical protein